MIIAGGTGFLGKILISHFAKDYEIVVLSRRNNQIEGAKVATWNGKTRSHWVREMEGAQVVINLSGKSVNCRYHKKNRERIFSSRVYSTTILGQVISELENPPAIWLNASTATIYRHAEDRAMDERTGEHGHGFSVDVAELWEKTFFGFDLPNTRQVALRSSFVLGDGQALSAFKNLVKFGMGGHHGNGSQFVSWIHANDFARAVGWIIRHTELKGAINVTSNHPVTEAYFMKTLRELMNVPFGISHPACILEIGAFFLRTETELVLKSRRVVPAILRESGFEFNYKTIEHALGELISRAPHKAPRGILEIA